MCALRDNHALSAVSLACKYRLAQKPNRPPMKTINRRRKDGEPGDLVEADGKSTNRGILQSRLNSLVFGVADEEEEYDYDGMILCWY